MAQNDKMLPIGTKLHGGVYEIIKHLSNGGFGNTYVVKNVSFDEIYAMKEFFMKGINLREGDIVTGSVADNEATFTSQKEKLKKEARRLRQLKNPHIVRVHDLFEERGTVYYVMDYIEGESLAARLQRENKPLTEKETLDFLEQILDALNFVHSQKPQLLHLDIKPANIMVDTKGCAYLIDFGASKQLTADESQTLSTSSGMSYTAGYAPIEQIEQNFDRIGPWTDYYALGATLYKLLTLKKPPTPSEINEDVDEAFTFPSNVSAKTQQLIRWMMTPNRKNRPQSVGEIRLFMSRPLSIPNIAKVTHPSAESEETIYAGKSIRKRPIRKIEDEETLYSAKGKKQTEPAGSEYDYNYEDEPSAVSKYWKHALACVVLIGLAYFFFNRYNSLEFTDNQEIEPLITEQVDTTQAEVIESQNNEITGIDQDERISDKEVSADKKKEDVKKEKEDKENEESIVDNNKKETDNKALEAMLANMPNETPVKPTVASSSNEVKKSDNIEKVYDVVEQMPSFPGGQAKLMNYLNSSIKYPSVAKEMRIQGSVGVAFIVERDGSISNVHVIKSVDPSLDKEAMRVVRSMPRWSPGMQIGSAVRVKSTVMVSFRL